MLAWLSVLLCAALVPQAPPTFRAVVLESPGPAGAQAINAAGVSAGWITGLGQYGAAATWGQSGALTVLDRVGGHTTTDAKGISSDGLVVGCALTYPTFAPCAWIPSGGGFLLPMRSPAVAVAVSPAGDILAQVGMPGPGLSAVLFPRGSSPHTIDFGGTGYAFSVSSDLRVVGSRSTSGSNFLRAFRWTAGSFEDLMPAPGYDGSEARWIGEDGIAYGETRNSSEIRAAYWTLDGAPHVLPAALPGAYESRAYGANANGWIVGMEIGPETIDPEVQRIYGALWINGNGYDLNALTVEGPPVVVQYAAALNDSGQIVGHGLLAGVVRAVRLDPIP